MISKFTDIGVPEAVAKAMDDMGWEEPTPIQLNSVPLGLQKRDMFGQAQTGTGISLSRPIKPEKIDLTNNNQNARKLFIPQSHQTVFW